MLTLLCTLSSLGISYRQPWLYHIFGAIPWLFLFLETQDTNGNCLICHCDGRRRRQTILFHKNETKQYKTKEKTHHQQQKKKTREHKLQVMKYRLLIVFVPTRLIFQSFVGLVLPTDLCTEKHDYVAQFPGQNRRGSSLGCFTRCEV